MMYNNNNSNKTVNNFSTMSAVFHHSLNAAGSENVSRPNIFYT